MAPPPYSSYMVKPYQGFSVVIRQTNYVHGKMILPKFFVDNYVEELSDAAIVSVPCGGCTWKLGVIKSTDGSVWFDEGGFEQFMSYYSIKLGYKLAFSYKGLSNFKVRIYTCEGSEINYNPSQNGDSQHHTAEADSSNATADTIDPAAADDVIVLDDDDDDVEDDDNDDDDADDTDDADAADDDANDAEDAEDADDDYELPPVVLKPKRGRPQPCKEGEEARVLKMRLEETGMATNEDFYKTFASLSPGSKRAVIEASMMKPKEPSFIIVVKQTNVVYRRLYFPKRFWRMHMMDDQMPSTSNGNSSKHLHIIINEVEAAGGGRGWEAAACFLTRGGVIVRCKNFMVENSLRDGDVCVFELVPPANSELKVSILHAT